MSEHSGLEYPLVAEARDLDIDEEDLPDDGFPVEAVTWPDGRVDLLPHTCVNWDLGPTELLAGRHLMHIGCFNLNAGMVGGYPSADLGQLGGDVFYSRAGDIDEVPQAWHLRGTLREVIQYWIRGVESAYYVPPWPWAELILCSHYGLLQDVPACESDSYGVNLFADEPDEDMDGVMLDFEHDLAQEDMDWLVHTLEAGGCTWPGQVARKEPYASAAWEGRVRRWAEGFAQ
jgi:hypothetical protein